MLHLTFGNTDVTVNATSTLSRLLAATHRRYWNVAHSRTWEQRLPRSITVDIALPDRSPEFALRSAQREIAGQVAALHHWYAVEAAVVERRGRALALVGAPESGKSTIAAHFLARGWRLIADDVAFIDVDRASVVAHQGLMTFRSGAIPHLPAAFRGTLERSRWFVDENGELAFYEVDPASVFGSEAWGNEAVLDAIVVIDEAIGTEGVEAIDRAEIGLRALDGRAVPLQAFADLRAGIIRKDRSRRSADRIERWYDGHADP